MRKLILILSLLAAAVSPSLALANTSAHLDHAPVDLADHASLQRGAKMFVNYCLNCHSAASMRYNRLHDIGLTDDQIKQNLLFAGEKVGDTMTVAMNQQEAKGWFGATPPDLSVIARARGADWLYTYLRSFYRDSTRPTGWNNTVFDKVGMPHVLYELQGEQSLKVEESVAADGSKVEKHHLVLDKPGKLSPQDYNAAVADLVNYLVFMGEPASVVRTTLGWFVLLFLGVLLVLAVLLKKEFWKDVH